MGRRGFDLYLSEREPVSRRRIGGKKKGKEETQKEIQLHRIKI